MGKLALYQQVKLSFGDKSVVQVSLVYVMLVVTWNENLGAFAVLLPCCQFWKLAEVRYVVTGDCIIGNGI